MREKVKRLTEKFIKKRKFSLCADVMVMDEL